MNTLNDTGLAKFISNLKLKFASLTDAINALEKVLWIPIEFRGEGQDYFTLSDYFTDGMTYTNTELAMEMIDYGAISDRRYYIMDTIRIPLKEVSSYNSRAFVLKAGYNPQPGGSTNMSATMTITINSSGTVNVINSFITFDARVRFYLRKIRM